MALGRHRPFIFFAASLRYETVFLLQKELKRLEKVVNLHAVGSAMRRAILMQFEFTEICYLLGRRVLLSQDFSGGSEIIDDEAIGPRSPSSDYRTGIGVM